MSVENMSGADALRVLMIIDSEGWNLTRNLPADYLTDECNTENAWSVVRTEAPFCADRPATDRSRMWNGPTPLAALEKAKAVMDPEIARYKARRN